jgi:hypothetical protein
VRWSREIGAGRLFTGLGLGELPASSREVARRAVQALCGHAPVAWREAPVEHQAFAGVRHVS